MEHEEIRALVALMKEEGLGRVLIQEGDRVVELERESSSKTIMRHVEGVPQSVSTESLDVDTGKFVTSPMVGTFYAAPSPQQPNFVQVGEKVSENSLVCIVEAMKVMNEVKAGVSGIIDEVLIENGHPVEFGTKLFRIK